VERQHFGPWGAGSFGEKQNAFAAPQRFFNESIHSENVEAGIAVHEDGSHAPAQQTQHGPVRYLTFGDEYAIQSRGKGDNVHITKVIRNQKKGRTGKCSPGFNPNSQKRVR
jgi:hypothetical protein